MSVSKHCSSLTSKYAIIRHFLFRATSRRIRITRMLCHLPRCMRNHVPTVCDRLSVLSHTSVGAWVKRWWHFRGRAIYLLSCADSEGNYPFFCSYEGKEKLTPLDTCATPWLAAGIRSWSLRCSLAMSFLFAFNSSSASMVWCVVATLTFI